MSTRRRFFQVLTATGAALALRVPLQRWTFGLAYRAYERGQITAVQWGDIVRRIALEEIGR